MSNTRQKVIPLSDMLLTEFIICLVLYVLPVQDFWYYFAHHILQKLVSITENVLLFFCDTSKKVHNSSILDSKLSNKVWFVYINYSFISLYVSCMLWHLRIGTNFYMR